jgi:hypothetical protein
MTAELMTLPVRSRRQWRAWLAKHHTSSPGVWLVFYKAHRGIKSIRYEDTVREALCFGWIDSLVKRLDGDRYALKVTPRRPTSKWSDINRKTVGGTQGGRRGHVGRSRGGTNEEHLRATTRNTRPTRLHRQSAEDEIQSVGVLSEAGANRPTSLCGLDSYG